MKKLIYLDDTSRFFEERDKSLVFTGKEMYVLVPKNYADSKLYRVDDVVRVLGILKYVINDTYYFISTMLVMLSMDPSQIVTTTEDGESYYKLIFRNGEKVITNTSVIKNPDFMFAIYIFFIALGKIPKFIDYKHVHRLFDKTEEFCDINLRTNKVIFEMIFSHLYRDPDDVNKPYRLVPRKTKKPTVVGLMTISAGPESNLAKISGSFYSEGLMSSLVNDPDKIMEVENLFRS